MGSRKGSTNERVYDLSFLPHDALVHPSLVLEGLTHLRTVYEVTDPQPPAPRVRTVGPRSTDAEPDFIDDKVEWPAETPVEGALKDASARLVELSDKYRHDAGDLGELVRLWEDCILKQLHRQYESDALLATTREQLAEAREIVAKVNNTVIGSYGYFTKPDCVEVIDNMKLDSNRQYHKMRELEAELASTREERDTFKQIAENNLEAYEAQVADANKWMEERDHLKAELERAKRVEQVSDEAFSAASHDRQVWHKAYQEADAKHAALLRRLRELSELWRETVPGCNCSGCRVQKECADAVAALLTDAR